VFQTFRTSGFAALSGLLLLHATCLPLVAQTKSPSAPKSQKLPRPQTLGRNLTFERDAVSGELHSASPPASDQITNGAIRSRVTLVQVACTVTTPEGIQVRGLTPGNFRIFEDGTPQEIASFDASATPASIALVLDVSPSIYHDLAEMRAAARALAANLSPADEIAVVSFSAEAHVLLPFSTDRALLDRALDSHNLARVEDSSESNIYQSAFLTARELFRGRTGRKALVLLTDGQDSGLGLTWDVASVRPDAQATASSNGNATARLAFDDVAREFGADGVAVFIVSTEPRPRAMTTAWLEAHRGEVLVTPEARKQGMPHYTLYLAELTRRVSGQLYFLREIGNLSEIYRRIAITISAQYTLGYYPSAGMTRTGWRSLRVELLDNPENTSHKNDLIPAGSRITHRNSYYVSAFQ